MPVMGLTLFIPLLSVENQNYLLLIGNLGFNQFDFPFFLVTNKKDPYSVFLVVLDPLLCDFVYRQNIILVFCLDCSILCWLN